MIEQINLAVRLTTVGSSMLILMVVLLGSARRPLKLSLAGLLIGSAAYVIHSEPGFGMSWQTAFVFDVFSLMTPFWTWLFARHLFERAPDRRFAIGVAVFLIACCYIGTFIRAFWRVGFVGIHVVSLVLMLDLFRYAWMGRDDDLVEKRRLVRTWLPLLTALEAVGILSFELAFGPTAPNAELHLANALLIQALTLFAGGVLLRTERELLVETGYGDNVRRPRSPDELSPSERVLLEKLEAAMEGGSYRTPGLTIAMLAANLQTPEHRLRALINRRLGHRNFSAFLNLHRIAEAKVALADKARVDLPVLTIAMDLGYNSLPTFNRAFRETAGCTPTEFRRTAIGQE